MQKKFNTLNFGAEFIGYVAYAPNGDAAAYYGVFPIKISWEGKTYLAAQSGDTMTHHNHQGRGLFTQLAKKTYELCRSEGIHLVFGFPNQNSYPGFIKKLEWIHFDDLHAFEIRVRCFPWIRIKKPFRLPQRMHDQWCKFIFSLYRTGKPFSSSIGDTKNAVVDHSRDFFNYKSYGSNYLKRLGKYDVWFKHDELFLIIGDLNVHKEKEFRKVIRKLKRLAFFCGLPHLRMHVSTETSMIRWLEKYGKPLGITYPAAGIAFSNVIPLEMLKFTTADNDTF